MGLIKIFCFGCTIRSGALFSALYTLTMGLIYLGLVLIRYLGFEDLQKNEVSRMITISTFAVYGALVVASLVLVVGVHMDNKFLFMPWLVNIAVVILYSSFVTCVLLVSDLRTQGVLDDWSILFAVFHIATIIINIYCAVCVVSQFQDLVAGKGTAGYYRRRSTRRRRLTMIADLLIHGADRIPPTQMEIATAAAADSPCMEPPAYSENPPPEYSTLPRTNENSLSENGSHVNHAMMMSPYDLQRLESSYGDSDTEGNITMDNIIRFEDIAIANQEQLHSDGTRRHSTNMCRSFAASTPELRDFALSFPRNMTVDEPTCEMSSHNLSQVRLCRNDTELTREPAPRVTTCSSIAV